MQATAIERDAGISTFDQFGAFNSIYMLAGGDCTKFDAVFNLSYSEAFTTLARKATEARYQQRLNELLKNKAG